MTERAYEILGVDATASDAQVRAAYRRLAQIYHPDRFGTAPNDIRQEAERRMAELNAAFSEISRLRPVSSDQSQELPSWWNASWDRHWVEEERWQEELKRRRIEDEQRRATHQRWEQIERIYRERAEAWSADHPMDADATQHEGSAPPSGLPEARSDLSSRIEKASRERLKARVEEARKTAADLRRTIDLTSSEKNRAKAARKRT
jgi:curved DNA-binding protein CbpA